MKRLIFVRDKKVVKMYIVYIILGLLLNILALTEIIKPLVYNTSYIFFAMAISLIIDIIILKKLSSIVRLYDDKIKIGYLFSRTIYIKDIKDINKINYILFNDTIELNVKYQYSNIKINVFPFGNDREKHKTLLKHINDRSEEKFNVDVALDRLSTNLEQKYQTNKLPLKFKGWTKLLVYHLTIPVIGAGKNTMALFESKDGIDWTPCQDPLASARELLMEDGQVRKFENLERPQIWLKDGKPTVLFCAINEKINGKIYTGNIHIPLK